jgi:ectoine hydroxylase-related dioxygenase (phytanoyl-CoA dioxygenase family)
MESNGLSTVTSFTSEASERLQQDGCLLLSEIFDPSEVEHLRSYLDPLLHNTTEAASILNRAGLVFAARNVLKIWPEVQHICHKPRLLELLEAVLGRHCGLVRVLYFDKPPGQTWALPWHKDVTIAIQPPNALPLVRGQSWNKVRMKAGVPHVEADEAILSQMLTLRIHLDPTMSENGALCVSPGSHQAGKTLDLDIPRQLVSSNAGDVFVMRPLLSHCSGQSAPETSLRRRILHLEFSASDQLPHGYQWHTFLPVFT